MKNQRKLSILVEKTIEEIRTYRYFNRKIVADICKKNSVNKEYIIKVMGI